MSPIPDHENNDQIPDRSIFDTLDIFGGALVGNVFEDVLDELFEGSELPDAEKSD